MTYIDMTGEKIGFWTIIKKSQPTYKIGKSTPAFWECKCECGNVKVVRGDILRNGRSKSCGCWDKLENGFERALQKKTRPGANGCIEWLGRRDKDGYGRYGEKGKIVTRLIFEKIKGKLNKNELVCHSCDNPGCVNIEHLWKGNVQENATDMVNKGRSLKGSKHNKTHLKESDIDHIRILSKEGVFQSIIAEEYNVCQSTISTIVLNKFWKHV